MVTQLVMYLCLMVSVMYVSGGVSYIQTDKIRSPFNYQTYYRETYPPRRTQALTPNGVKLLRSANPITTQDQIRATGFDDVGCNIRDRTWRVKYTNALSSAVFGDTVLTALGQCYQSNSGVPKFDLIETDKFEEIDDVTGFVVTTVEFVLDSPNIRQNVLSCTFELFTENAGDDVQPPSLFQVFSHLCDRKSGGINFKNTSGSGCNHGDLWCLIDADEYKGAAIFWDFIIGLEVIALILGFFFIYVIKLRKNEKVFTEVGRYASGRRSQFDDKDDNLMGKLNEMDDHQLESLLHKLHSVNGPMTGGAHMQYAQYNPGMGQPANTSDKVKSIYNDIFTEGQKRMDYSVPVHEYHDDSHDRHSIAWNGDVSTPPGGVSNTLIGKGQATWGFNPHSHNTRAWSGLTGKPYGGDDTDDDL